MRGVDIEPDSLVPGAAALSVPTSLVLGRADAGRTDRPVRAVNVAIGLGVQITGAVSNTDGAALFAVGRRAGRVRVRALGRSRAAWLE